MAAASAEFVDQAPPKRKANAGGPVALLLVVAAVAGGAWYWMQSQSAAKETAATAELNKLGALVVKDASQTHVASINLSTIKSADALRRAIALLPDLVHLSSLDVSRTTIADQDLEQIGQIGSLSSLVLSVTEVTDQGIAKVAGLKTVQAIYLGSTKVTDVSLETLGTLPRLRIVDVSATKVGGDLTPLTKLPQLEWLVLGQLKLADGALPSLAACKALRRLSLGESEYSAASLDKLKAALPTLTVDR